jgi:nucleoside-diphosphate-sugar epimerase
VSDPGRVLVTGAAGRLGRAVCALLADAGVEFVGTDIADVPDADPPLVRADLRDHTAALDVLAGVDAVVHLGNRPGIGVTPPQVVFNENVTINENVFQGAAELGVGRIVFASTIQLVGSHPDRRTVVDPPSRPAFPWDGDTAAQPSNVYSLSKAVSETMLRYYVERCGLDAVALRFPLLHRWQDRVRVAFGEETATDVYEGFTGLHVDDAAAVVLAVLRADLPGYRAYAPATSHRHRDLSVEELLRTFYPEDPADLPDLVDVTALAHDTGWRPPPVPGAAAAGSAAPTHPTATPDDGRLAP